LIGGRYRITSRLGAGGMGVVYHAIDEQLQRPAAVKFLPQAVAGETDRLARFKNEARALAALNHPHILTIYEVGEAEGLPFIATELVDGYTLRERLRNGPMPVGEAVGVALQVARALAAAHSRHIVHRDIKPDNVMIRTDGYVKVLDFGLAALCAPASRENWSMPLASFETVAADVVGTPGYMSPEQIEGGPIDARTDVFSLAVMLCEAVTGTNPFARASVFETISAIAQTPAPAAPVVAKLPQRLQAVLLHALRKDPAERYQTADQFISALEHANAPHAPRSGRRLSSWTAAALIVAVAFMVAASLWLWRLQRRQWAREQAIPTIERLAREEKNAAAFSLIQAAERYLPNDAQLARAAASSTRVVAVESSPAGAVVEVQDYLFPTDSWVRIGTTPLAHVRIPAGYLRWKISKPGFPDSITAPRPSASFQFDLAGLASAPAEMVPIPPGTSQNYLAFLGWLGPYDLPGFFIDRHEVTNREYQEFVDRGGYSTREYWTQPFVRDGREIGWEEAMSLLRDATQRPGPSTWTGGHYPEGTGDNPVTGVSWYEAAAYAQFSGKDLPVIAQWGEAAPSDLDQYIVRVSNLSGPVAPSSAFNALGPYGTYDLVGNAREWYWNATTENQRFLLGRHPGSYGPEALPPFDRSPLNGFRCVRNSAPLPLAARAPLRTLYRDFSAVTPASDQVFRAYREMYAYDTRPLHATVEDVPDRSTDWTRQRITFDAAYGNERMHALLFLPRRARPPYQVVIFFPSARVNELRNSDEPGDMDFVDYVIQSGRAVMYPIYQYLYERQQNAPPEPGPTLARETVIDWSKDLGRSIDYLETRTDIDRARIGYLGVSQGAAYGVILTAIEDRVKAVVLLDGGYFQTPHPPAGIDQVDFAPRLTKPILMVNGQYDATFPVSTAQEPLFRMLGTPAADKRHVKFEAPHDVRLRHDNLVREVLDWFDRYLGRVD
jgi:serine/threonine protein kinase/dienelactone hydrolase